MASKAEVLKRYMDASGGNGGKEKKSKKTSKVSRHSGLKVVDSADDEWGHTNRDEEDAPVIVDSSELNGASQAVRGSWAEIQEVQPLSKGSPGSDSEPPRRRKRRDSDSDSDAAPPRRPKEQAPIVLENAAQRRHDSSDSEPPRRPKRRGSESDSDDAAPPRRPAQTASGHAAGLQSAEEFRQHESRLRQEREAAMAQVDPSLAGRDAQTTYRDRKGRKLDMLNEFMRQQAVAEGRAVQLERAQQEWGRGTVQKEMAEQAKRELELLADEPFARAADDPRMEAMRKQALREGDPMAEFIASQRAVAGVGAGADGLVRQDRKKVYKGPAPPPNRFNILPGYRWDGNDRGNGWENKVLKRDNEKRSVKADGAAWSMADM